MSKKGGQQNLEPEYLYLRVRAGDSINTNALAPKLGPKGIPPRKAAEQIQKVCKDFSGLKVTIRVTIIGREFTVDVMPTASTLIIKALNEPPHEKSADFKHTGNLSLEQVKEIARQMRHKSLANEFEGVVKEMLGTCVSVGCTVEKKSPKEIQQKIKNGEIIIPDEEPEEVEEKEN
ncbi:ribosomal protein L12 [Anaeramoeba flamelloides]|uniref:Ribosomal protein L12 n=1 Tax=Anaeramoeba flamelloides TaxID=1746091 RepID=A0AAV7Z8V0_9EUKA|nr:ribosomal protein L12 [Anaeramoeba flamelloides]KAJ3438481.1 ribosomal protein L12 [Anaeramoeba flamelloides]KAJ3445390.1 ribosomal protein L12 [Anaeramoeba flamelloides]KAJ3445695.1 ribosomal protein L12 [Anaeramoeba flamelloides]KAJ3448667.1 ribosomal protein L12 [Anaeramoeba flamelloides]|eukprot:Anaeramoba_flamelloidesa1401_882.p1 GENE.a1401_882~~a1401_882.p1  ORF type:complete len:193 (+),score=56.57 a1401_882:54-581(+)